MKPRVGRHTAKFLLSDLLLKSYEGRPCHRWMLDEMDAFLDQAMHALRGKEDLVEPLLVPVVVVDVYASRCTPLVMWLEEVEALLESPHHSALGFGRATSDFLRRKAVMRLLKNYPATVTATTEETP